MRVPGTTIVYFGTPEVAVAPLRAMHRAGHEVVLVVTRPPVRRGRRASPTPSPVAAAAVELGLDVTWDPADALAADADLGVVVAYGELIDEEVLQRRRTVNLHFSLLPRWRGAAPVERAILAGDAATGVCLMEVASEIDTGAVYRRVSIAISPNETADELRARLCQMGIELLLEAVSEGFGDPVPQSGETTWAHKITTSDLRIDWSSPAEHVLRLVRVGGAWTTFRGRRLRVLAADMAAGVEADEVDGMAAGTATEVVAVAAGVEADEVDGMAAVTATDVVAGSEMVSAAVATGRAPSGTISLRHRAGRGPAVEVVAGQGALELVTVQSEGRGPSPARDWWNGARVAVGERLGG